MAFQRGWKEILGIVSKAFWDPENRGGSRYAVQTRKGERPRARQKSFSAKQRQFTLAEEQFWFWVWGDDGWAEFSGWKEDWMWKLRWTSTGYEPERATMFCGFVMYMPCLFNGVAASSLIFESLYYSLIDSLFLLGKNLYNNEHVAIKLVSRNHHDFLSAAFVLSWRNTGHITVL